MHDRQYWFTRNSYCPSTIDFLIVYLAGVMGLPTEGLRGPVGLISDFFGPPGDERDLGGDIYEPAPALLPVLVPTLAPFPLPEVALEERFSLEMLLIHPI